MSGVKTELITTPGDYEDDNISADVIIADITRTIFQLIVESNQDKYLPDCKSYQLFDEGDTDCYGVNPDKHHDVSQESIENYIWEVYQGTQMEQECLIPTIMYLKKLLDSQQDCFASKLRIYSRNWKTVVGMSMLIAAKVWDDFHMDVGSAVQFLYCMDLQRCNKLEVQYLMMIDFDVSIKKVAFCDYEEDISVRHSFSRRPSDTPTAPVAMKEEEDDDGVESLSRLSPHCNDGDEVKSVEADEEPTCVESSFNNYMWKNHHTPTKIIAKKNNKKHDLHCEHRDNNTLRSVSTKIKSRTSGVVKTVKAWRTAEIRAIKIHPLPLHLANNAEINSSNCDSGKQQSATTTAVPTKGYLAQLRDLLSRSIGSLRIDPALYLQH